MHALIVGKFWEILWHALGYFEQQSKVLEFAIIIIIVVIAGINVYYNKRILKESNMGEKEKTAEAVITSYFKRLTK